MWSAPSTDSRLGIGLFSVITAILLVAGTTGATARSWSSPDELSARSGTARYDTVPPSAPTGLALTRVTRSVLSLEWQPSRDDRRLRAYAVYRDGTYVGAAWRKSATVRGLACGRTYRISVAALDHAGNRSESASINASTSSCSETGSTTQPENKTKPDRTTPATSRPVTPKTPPSPPVAPAPRPQTESPPAAPAGGAELGVFRGSGNLAEVQAFGTWLGRQPTVAIDYLPWESVRNPIWWTQQWRGKPYRVSYSLPMIPAGGSLQACGNGSYDADFRGFAQVLAANGQGNSIIRPGWEFNGEWMSWNARSDPAAYAACFRRIVNVSRSVPGQAFEFDWCPSFNRAVPEAAYPGDAYVDYIGLDVYDPAPWYSQDPATRWSQMLTTSAGGSLNWHRDFARQHGKRMSFPEWGLWGVDNAYFIERMRDWFRQNNVGYQAYFDVDVNGEGQHRIAAFPQASARYRALFGAG